MISQQRKAEPKSRLFASAAEAAEKLADGDSKKKSRLLKLVEQRVANQDITEENWERYLAAAKNAMEFVSKQPLPIFDKEKHHPCRECEGEGISKGTVCSYCDGTGILKKKEQLSFNRWNRFPYIFINGDVPRGYIEDLSSELSFYVEGFERTEKFKTGRWDGKERLLYRTRNSTYYFPVGLLGRAMRLAHDWDLRPIVNDIKLDDVARDYPKIKFKWNGPPLRDYQKRAVTEVLKRGGGVISAPTGSGKTLIMLRVFYELGLPFLVVVHTKELLYQWEREIKEKLGIHPGLVGDGHKIWDNVCVCMMQSVSKVLNSKIPEKPKIDYPILAIDEVHRAPADTAYKIAMHVNAPFRLGASATPYRTDGKDLKIFAAVGEMVVNIEPTDMIGTGVLAEPKFEFIVPPPSDSSRLARGSRKWHEIYTHMIVANESRNGVIARKALEYARGGHSVYIHVDRIDHGDILAGLIPGAVFLQGKDVRKRRDSVLTDFRSGKIKILISTLLKEGVDIPTISCFIAASGGKSRIAVIQRMGRALRRTDDKQDAIIVDFKDYGHKIISRHWAQRYEIYKMTFGEYCPDIRA